MNWNIHFWGEHYRILNILDLLLVIFLIYQLYRLLRGSIAFNIFIGLVVVYCGYLLVRFLQMPLLTDFLQKIVSIGLLAIIIILQPEIRRFLLLIGKNTPLSRESSMIRFLSFKKFQTSRKEEEVIQFIIMAVGNMANTYTGALIVFTNTFRQRFESSGVLIDAQVSARLIESIFQNGTPLHDGAVIISNNKILAAKVVLPVSENPDLPPRIGLRHRSAVGATEHNDALAIVVSEEKGTISYAKDGRLFLNISLEELKVVLYETLIDNK